ncbi:hypothetical protein D3C73_651100 [compost metagenome]
MFEQKVYIGTYTVKIIPSCDLKKPSGLQGVQADVDAFEFCVHKLRQHVVDTDSVGGHMKFNRKFGQTCYNIGCILANQGFTSCKADFADSLIDKQSSQLLNFVHLHQFLIRGKAILFLRHAIETTEVAIIGKRYA